MASPFDGIDPHTVQILGLVYPEGREREGREWKGMGRKGGDGKGMEGKGRNGRGIDTVKRRLHFLGVNRNYNIYIIPIYA